MAHRDDIVRFADRLLDVPAYPDYGPMGLQVIGASEVTRIACGVSASLALFERAAEAGAQLLLVHHGLFWDRESRVVDRMLRARLEALFRADITLAAYHLALDAHPKLGNNALLCRTLGIEPEERVAEVGFGGRLAAPCAIEELAARVASTVGRSPLQLPGGPELIERVAVCSGAAARYLGEVAAAGYDCFVTGEAAEPSMMAARELGIHMIAAGHYATETLGVQALAQRLADEFELEWGFLDLPNPV